MRYLFSFVMLAHGLIHFMGFANGFGFSKLNTITKFISKPTAVVWLCAALLFTAATVFYLLKKEQWAFIAVVAVLLSQLLIVLYWKDAKVGTVANFIVLLVAIPALGNWQFNNMYKKEVKRLLSKPINTSSKTTTHDHLRTLPISVQKWLEASGVLTKPAIQKVYLTQRGEMKSTPAGKWLPFEAEQYFTINPPAFTWKTNIHPSAFLSIAGRDKFEQGKGHMLIKAYGLFTVADNKGAKTDQGTLLRYLAEICWFPSAALSEQIRWESIDEHSAKATMHYGDVAVSGIFSFKENGDLEKFEATRYYINNNHSSLEKWQVTCIDHKTINGIRIPVKNNVTWKLKDGDFTWLELEITNIQFTFTT